MQKGQKPCPLACPAPEGGREKYVDCKRCAQDCPMSLDMNGLVHTETIEHSACVLCGTCVDGCPQGVIRYSFGGGR